MTSKKKIIMYFFDDQWYGHICKVRFLYESLKQDYDILLFCFPSMKERFFADIPTYILPDTGFEKKQVFQRVAIIRKVLQFFQADIFLMDFFPFWKYQLRWEMREIMYNVKKRWGKVYSFMRDVFIGEPLFPVQEDYHTFYSFIETKYRLNIQENLIYNQERILKHLHKESNLRIFRTNLFLSFFLETGTLDGVLVFGDSDIAKLEEEFIISENSKKKFHYFGYIIEDINRRAKSLYKEKKKIIVSSWGNATSEKQFLQLIFVLSQMSEYSIDIFLWDFLRPGYREYLEKYFQNKNNIRIYSFVSWFREKLQEYDFYFGFGWYGTFIDLVYEWIPSFIIPNYDNKQFVHRKLEQENRLFLLKGKINVFVLEEITLHYIQSLLQKKYTYIKDPFKLADSKELKDFISQEV